MANRSVAEEIVLLTIPRVLLWICGGLWIGYDILDIHEWGMYWLLAILFILPAVVVLAIVAANVVAANQNYQNPQRLVLVIVSSWYVISFVIARLAVSSGA